jgi:hypothetical protein
VEPTRSRRLGLVSPTGEEVPPEEIIRMLQEYMLSLPADRFPRTLAAIDIMFDGRTAERFEFALDLIVRGLETYASPAEPAYAGGDSARRSSGAVRSPPASPVFGVPNGSINRS